MKNRHIIEIILLSILSSCSLMNSSNVNRLPSSTNLMASQCQYIFARELAPDQALMDTILSSPFNQLRKWEQKSNTARWEKPSEDLELGYILVEPDDVIINELTKVTELKQTLMDKDGKIRWFQHPENTASNVPYYEATPAGSIPAQYSASRSMFVKIKNQKLFSFKLPTNKPHPNGENQPGKADLVNDSILSIRRSKYINQVDKKIGKDKDFLILTEVLSISSKNGGNGFSIRDLRPLADGNQRKLYHFRKSTHFFIC